MYVLILNPAAGSGAPMVHLDKVEALLQARGIEYRVERAGDGECVTEIARRVAAEAPETIISIGGDGTIFDIANGMAGSRVPLLFVSCGTGNDFVRSLNLPKNPLEALELQLDSPLRQIDVGRMNELYFMNVSGTGFDVDVLRYADKYKLKYDGLKPYLFGLRDALKCYKPTTAMVSYDGAPEVQQRFAILSIGNGRYFGGGMKAVPEARVDDGVFDVITVAPVPKLLVLPLIAFYIAGLHKKLGLAKLRRCKKVSIRCEGMTINLDGELRDANTAQYELLPGALFVRLPQ